MTKRATRLLSKAKPEGPVGIELRVNGRKAVRAMLPGEGVLVFHVAVERALKTESALKTVCVEGGDLYGLDTSGSRFMRWANLNVAVGDKVELCFVIGGTSSPRPRVFSVDDVPTRIGLTEQLRVLRRQLGEVQRKLALDEPELRKRGEKDLAKARRWVAAHMLRSRRPKTLRKPERKRRRTK